MAKSLLFRYVSKEFLLNFLVSFTFFFLIFFVNSILLLVQKIMLKNITMPTMLMMVMLSMPQFLIYTIPFATLSGTSMVLGDLNSSNELLAFRSSGVSLMRIFFPIVVWAIVFSAMTYMVSDFLLPWSNIIYRQRLTELMVDLPTFEIESNTINTIGSTVLSNGTVEGERINDIIMMDTSPSGGFDKTISAPGGNVEMVDIASFLYKIELDGPEILVTDRNDQATSLISKSSKGTLYLDFSNQVPALTSTSPANLSSRQLLSSIRERDAVQQEERRNWEERRQSFNLEISNAIKDGLKNGGIDGQYVKSVLESIRNMGSRPIDFYAQYYKAEFAKKSALSLACLCLSLVALPFALLKLKYGRLTGFAISLIVAVGYWYILFFSQLKIFDISFSPYILIYSADLIVLLLALFFMFLLRKAR